VHLRSPSYDVTLSVADIDFKAGVYRSDQPVTVVTGNGATIHADSAEAQDNGAELTSSATSIDLRRRNHRGAGSRQFERAAP